MTEHPVIRFAREVDCLVRDRRRTMSDEEFWDDVFHASGIAYPYDEEDELEKCFGIDAATPCPECGSVVACGYDSEGRPMIHVKQEDDYDD